jgi:protein-S-isoprenylcysteine O-methyltransferase Ste14
MKKLWQSLHDRMNSTLVMTIIVALIGAGVGFFFPLQSSAVPARPAHTWQELMNGLKAVGLPLPMVGSIALWMLLYIYWEVAAHHAAAAVETESRPSRFIHVLLLNVAQLILFLPVYGLRARFIPNQLFLILIGFIIQLGFLIFALWARRSLGQNWSGAIATTVNQQLLQSGPYKFIRHPIYTGLLGMYLGTSFISGELHALVGFAIAALAYWRKIRLEEQHLHALFGSEYEEYCSTTWALIPGII